MQPPAEHTCPACVHDGSAGGIVVGHGGAASEGHVSWEHSHAPDTHVHVLQPSPAGHDSSEKHPVIAPQVAAADASGASTSIDASGAALAATVPPHDAIMDTNAKSCVSFVGRSAIVISPRDRGESKNAPAAFI
jgi:hypothetical protein